MLQKHLFREGHVFSVSGKKNCKNSHIRRLKARKAKQEVPVP
jgi:hypothetical protein